MRDFFTRALLAVACVASACATFEGSPDSPGFDGTDDQARPFAWIRRWTVIDVDTGEQVVAGCSATDDGLVSAKLGQRLLYELQSEYLSAPENTDVSDEFWCSHDPRIRRDVREISFDPECWQSAGDESAGRAIWWDVDARERPDGWPDELPEFVPGPGKLRIWFEVVGAEHARLASNGTCDTDPFFGAFTIKCERDLPCIAGLLCKEGTCVSSSCSSEKPCPDTHECLNGSCRAKVTP